MTGTMTNHIAYNSASSTGTICNGAPPTSGSTCNGAPPSRDVTCNGASPIIHHMLSLDGESLQTHVSSVEERQIGNVLLRIIHHNSDHCKEFAVVNLSFKVYQWLTGMIALICIGYYLQLHLRVSGFCFSLLFYTNSSLQNVLVGMLVLATTNNS